MQRKRTSQPNFAKTSSEVVVITRILKIPGKLTRSQYTDYLYQLSLIKERLFAVEVCAILPSGMNSVCFFYDPDMKARYVGIWACTIIIWALYRYLR